MFKPLLAIAAMASAATLASPAAAQSTKKELVAKIVQLQQQGVEGIGRQMVEQPAMQLMQAAGQALQRLPQERREAVGKDIEADVRKFVDEASVIVRERSAKAGPAVMSGPLEERFTEDELKQIIAVLESPVLRRFQQSLSEFQQPLRERIVQDSRSAIEPKIKALQDATSKRLGLAPAPAASGAKKAP